MVRLEYLASMVNQSVLHRVVSELRLLREHQEPSLRSTTESKPQKSWDPFNKCLCRLTGDFHTNKRIIDDIAVIQTKRLRNKIAGKLIHGISKLTFSRVYHTHDEENCQGSS